MSDQIDVVRALGDPGFYPHRPGRVEHVQTHISHVFLAGPFVYKLKKAVRFPFLDFGTSARRAHFCAEEVRLNRRLCPAVYLDVIPVTRAPDGTLRLGGAGEVVEPLVWMRRLPAERMLVRLLGEGGLRPEMLDALAAQLAAFHAAARSGPEVAAHAAPDRLAAQWEENLGGAGAFVGTLLAAEELEILWDFGAGFVRRHETLLRARQQAGRIREGHGDVHAEHVCFVDAPVRAVGDVPPLAPGIYVFDCIEFSLPLRCVDVASEVAFLAMDLTALERPDLAARFVTAYAAAAADPTLPVLVPFYACYRACVRGKVEGLASVAPELEPADRAAAVARARRHFALAGRYAWSADGPAVIACCGLSGSGKTTLAAALADTTGFTHLGSDALRERAAGSVAYGSGRYTPAARAAVYHRLAAETEAALAAGRGVIADATFLEGAARDRLAAVARRQRRPLVWVECRGAEPVVRARLDARDAGTSLSDARWETYVAQRAHREPLGAAEPTIVVDTSGDAASARTEAMRCLWSWRQGRPLGPRGGHDT